MASNKHAQIRYKVLDDCFSNFRRKFYFDDLIERCNEALRELYGEEHTGIKTRTLRADISYIRDRAGEAGVEVEVKDDGNGYYYRYSEPDFSIFKRGLGEDDLAQLKETILMLQRFKGMPNFDWMSELVVKLEDKFNLRGVSRSVVGYDENKAYTGLDKYQKFSFGVNFVGGYRINDYFFVGAGAGYEYLDGLYYTSYEYHSGAGNSYHGTSNDVRNNIKVFGRLKANLTATKVSPFFAVDLGANFGLSSNEIKMANGFYFEPCFGCDFALTPKQAIYVMLGYNGIGYDYKAFDTTLGSAGSEMRHVLAGKFSIHLGFRF